MIKSRTIFSIIFLLQLIRSGFAMDNNPVPLSAQNNRDTASLHSAAYAGHVDVVEALLQAGAPIEARNKWGCTPLHLAAFAGHLEVVKALLQVGADMDAQERGGRTPLHEAAFKGNLEVVRALLQAGAPIEAKHSEGRTPLHVAAYAGHLDVVKILIQLLKKVDFDIDVQDMFGFNSLHSAAVAGHLDVVTALIQAGADMDAQESGGRTSLHLAAFKGHLNVVKALMQIGAPIEAKDSVGRTPLHVAAGMGYLDVLKTLIHAGASLEIQDSLGFTPPHLAICNNQLKITQLLLLTNKNLIRHKTTQFMNYKIRGGASIDLPAGSKLLDLARAMPDSENKQKMIELLESFEFFFAFQSRDAGELVAHAMDQKKVDWDLCTQDLAQTRFNHLDLNHFLEQLANEYETLEAQLAEQIKSGPSSSGDIKLVEEHQKRLQAIESAMRMTKQMMEVLSTKFKRSLQDICVRSLRTASQSPEAETGLTPSRCKVEECLEDEECLTAIKTCLTDVVLKLEPVERLDEGERKSILKKIILNYLSASDDSAEKMKP